MTNFIDEGKDEVLDDVDARVQELTLEALQNIERKLDQMLEQQESEYKPDEPIYLSAKGIGSRYDMNARQVRDLAALVDEFPKAVRFTYTTPDNQIRQTQPRWDAKEVRKFFKEHRGVEGRW